MRERPILFNTEMVRAILDGRKTQTRRLIKPASLGLIYEDGSPAAKPPVEPGDVLWVRETWKQYTTGTAGPGLIDGYLYKADEPQDTTGMMVEDRWHPSIHMPMGAARIFLKVKGVRIERLQDMTEDDAFCEGYDGMPWCYHKVFENYPDSPIPCDASSGYDCPSDRPCDKSIPELFGETIWNSTIKKSDLGLHGWEANPWVWVIEFEREWRSNPWK